ncbi:alpha-amylase family glycosyl hydrolase [Mesomycoplasma neurolyticum]|uniref:Pullulanase n=1 Tax=Mesomycoplasma neurolyticum TaxID=2120 RepID=A0A449A597_9BACT|nr:alpha-amylase family glycosyl hydrolase [Mesomycoplasma neurolyticum]VEU59402.1 Pullulanase [Mesomycoplasma neurolyticum]
MSSIKMEQKKYINQIDKQFATYQKLGLFKEKQHFILNFWAPLAIKVQLIIYNKIEADKIIKKMFFKRKNKIWQIKIPFEFKDHFYHIKIYNLNDKNKIVLDPYAKSLSTFDWNGETNNIPKAAIFDWEKLFLNKTKNKLKINTNENLIIYELNIRDFSSLMNNKNCGTRKGTFKCAQNLNVFKYLKKLNVNYLQLLPIHAIYTLNDKNLNILNKNEGNKFITNYNWGYDPMNYFSLAGWYFTDPSDVSNRIKEFKEFVDEAHKNNIGVIMDVVFNHLMTNKILEDILPNYYFRNNSKIVPVSEPALNTEAKMVRKLIFDSLIYFAKYFNIDGFRFDLSTFIDKTTLDLICKKLKKINPNIVLHGEAWQFSDLDYKNSYTKGITVNNYNFAYFNDTIRNAIKGNDSLELASNDYGLIQGNLNYLNDYLVSIVGNTKKVKTNLKFKNKKISYEVFAKDPNMSLQYSACHDGFTLWDKLVTTTDLPFRETLKLYRQALIMQFSVQGKQLILAGTELCQTKPTDFSGQDSEKSLKIINSQNSIFDFENLWVNSNSYKTTDYTNGIKWNNLNNLFIKKFVFSFTSKLLKAYKNSIFFNLNIKNKKIIFHTIKKDFIYYEIQVTKDSLFVMHNFSQNKKILKNIKFNKILFNSDFDNIIQNEFVISAKSSIIFK